MSLLPLPLLSVPSSSHSQRSKERRTKEYRFQSSAWGCSKWFIIVRRGVLVNLFLPLNAAERIRVQDWRGTTDAGQSMCILGCSRRAGWVFECVDDTLSSYSKTRLGCR